MLRSWSVHTAEKKMLATALGSALVLTFFPKTLTPVFFRTTSKPMTIRVTREAPPKEAFDQLFSVPEIDNEWKEIKDSPSTNLNLSSQRDNSWNPLVALNERKVSLPKMVFTREMVSANAEPADNLHWIAELPTSERLRLQAADDRSQVMSQDWQLPSWRESVAKKLDEARKAAGPRLNSHPNVFIPGKPLGGGDVAMRDLPPSHYNITGQVRLPLGLALGDRPLEIRRIVDGVRVDVGEIDAPKGTFSIPVAAMEGTLSIELSDKTGTVIASASHRLGPEDERGNLLMHVTAKSQFAGTFVSFNKEPNHLLGEKLLSIRGEPTEILYATLGVHDNSDALGSFAFPKISESSFGLIRARSKGFADTLLTLSAGEAKGISLLPTKFISALKQIIQGEQHQDLENSGMIFGQVLFDGKPMSGVSVTLDESAEQVPVYLSGFIPLQGVEATTENGYFAFTGLSKGMHTAVATRNGEYLGHLNLEVDDEAVSIGNLEASTKNQTTQIKVYDAFEGTPLSANVHIQSVKDSMQVLGVAEVYLPQIQRLSFGYVQPDQVDYLPYQMAYSDKDDFIHVPLVKADWLQNIFTERRITNVPDSGIVIGFVPEDDFEAYLSHEESYDSSNIVYFDMLGRIVPAGVTGGGFVMFNVPSGTQSIVVMSKKTEMLSTQVIPVGADSTTILKLRF